jgi:hypothetical protein
MATIVVGKGNKVRPYRNNRIAYFPEAASQSFEAGDIVKMASGKVAIAESDVAADGDYVIGVAAEDATGTTDTKIGVFVGTADAEFVANVQDTGTLAVTNIGVAYDIVYDTASSINIFRVDLGDTTNPCLIVTELVDAAGDVNGRVAFKFLNDTMTPYRA